MNETDEAQESEQTAKTGRCAHGNRVEQVQTMHWTRNPKNRQKLMKAAAKRRGRRKHTRRARRSSARSSASVRYAAAKSSKLIALIRTELRDAVRRVTALKSVLRKYQTVR